MRSPPSRNLVVGVVFLGTCLVIGAIAGGRWLSASLRREAFRESFGVEVPPEAREFESDGPAWADPGELTATLVCTKACTLGLIAAMRLTPRAGTTAEFLRVDADGTGYLLETDASFEHVTLRRDPLYAKPTNEPR